MLCGEDHRGRGRVVPLFRFLIDGGKALRRPGEIVEFAGVSQIHPEGSVAKVRREYPCRGRMPAPPLRGCATHHIRRPSPDLRRRGHGFRKPWRAARDAQDPCWLVPSSTIYRVFRKVIGPHLMGILDFGFWINGHRCPLSFCNRKSKIRNGQISAWRSRRALLMTETELKVMAAAASIGLNRQPSRG